MPLARGQKFLFGCLALFGVVVLAVIVAGALFVHWIKTPGAPLEGSRLADEATAVYAEVRLRPEDPGAREYVRAFLSSNRRPAIPADANLPGPMSWILGSIPRRDASDSEVDRVLPIVLVARVQETPEGAGPPLYGLSFSHAGNAVRLTHTLFNWLHWKSPMRREKEGEDDLYLMEDRGKRSMPSLWMSFVETNVLLSRDEAAIRSGIQAMRRTGPSEPPLLQARSAETSLFIAAKPGYAAAAAEAISLPAPALAGFLREIAGSGAGLTLAGTLRSADLLEGRLDLRRAGGGGRDVPELSGKMTLTEGSAPIDIAFEAAPPAEGASRSFKITMTGLQQAMRIRIERENRKGRD